MALWMVEGKIPKKEYGGSYAGVNGRMESKYEILSEICGYL